MATLANPDGLWSQAIRISEGQLYTIILLPWPLFDTNLIVILIDQPEIINNIQNYNYTFTSLQPYENMYMYIYMYMYVYNTVNTFSLVYKYVHVHVLYIV